MGPRKAQATSVDAAIAALESSTNSTITDKRTACGCAGQKHPLLSAAPNCLSCGKIICIREGFGPCLFCSKPLLSSDQVQDMLSELKAERGRERMAANNAAQDQHKKHRQQQQERGLDQARAHRDKLLGYQASSAQRTRIHDEAADFETISTGVSMWASPLERARQVKRQIQQMKEVEWEAKDEWEKRRMVVSLDISKGKVTKRMEKVEKPKAAAAAEEGEEEVEEHDGFASTIEPDQHQGQQQEQQQGPGAFSKNPLLGSLIRPVYRSEATDTDKGKGVDAEDPSAKPTKQTKWRRVQDDMDDNEAIILDGGIYGAGGSSGGV